MPGMAAFTGALAAKDVSKAPLEEVNYFGLLALSQALKNTPAFQSGGALLFYDLAIEKDFKIPTQG